MADSLTAPAPVDEWAQFQDAPAPADEWSQFQDAPAPTDEWAQFQDAPAAEDEWAQFQDAPGQSALETGARSFAQDLGSLAMTGVSGVGRWFENLSGVANEVVPGLGDVLDYAPQSALFQALKPVAEDLKQETEAVYAPDAERNPIAATVGGGMGQALGMVPMIATGGTPLVLGAAAASGFGEGSQTAEELGVQSPAGQMALGTGFGAAETLVERLGGIGAGPVKAGAREGIEELGKRTLKTIGSEAIEEPITGALQDVGSAVAAGTALDPNRPGLTVTGQPIAPLLPNDPAYWNRRGMEAIGGAAGGTVFAGLGLLAGRGQQSPTVEGDLPGAVPPGPEQAPTQPRVEVGGVTYEYDAAGLTADQVKSLAETGGLQEYLDSGMVRDAFAPPPPVPPPAADAGGVAVPGPVVADPEPSVVVAGAPTVAEARETLGDTGNVGANFAGASTVGRAGPPPLPRDLDGNIDLLNYLNENPIRAPRKGTEGDRAEYDWREAGEFDPTFRRSIMQEGAPNMDQRAQEAYDLGFIPEPTAEALAAGVREVIAKRQQQRKQGPGQARVMQSMEAAQTRFDQAQQSLRGTGQLVDLDEVSPGDTFTVNGESVTVADVEIDDMGRTTLARLSTPAGTVRVVPESGLRQDPTGKESLPVAPRRSFADVNAELAAWADQTIAQGQGQFSAGLDPTLLAAYGVKGAQLIAEGFTTFGKWSVEMVRRFGEAVRRYLKGAWEAARKTSQVGAINLGARISAREPTMAEVIDGQVRDSQFGERVQADERLTDAVREAPVSQFAVQSQQDALNAANAIIRESGLEAATARFDQDATLPMPVRIAGLMQSALQYDARASLAMRRGDAAGSAAADAATGAAIQAKANLEVFANEAGRNLAMFHTWVRMSPDGQLRRFERKLAEAGKQQVRGEIGTEVSDLQALVNEELAALNVDAIIEEAINEGASPQPVNVRTGEGLLGRWLGGVESVARGISESVTVQRAVQAIDDVLKALSGKFFADPLLITPIGQAVLKATRVFLMQGTKLSQAVADGIAEVRKRLPIPPANEAPLAKAVTGAIVKEVVRPILRKLAFDQNYDRREAVKDMLAIGIGVMEAGRLADAIIAKRPKIAKMAQAKVREAVMRRLSDKPRAKNRKQKLPAVLDTLVLAAGAGFINERQFLDAWDQKHGLPKISPADRKRLRDMAAAVNLLPEGILRQQAAQKFLNELALIEGLPASDMIMAAWYANILSGASTQLVNVYGNGLNIFFRTLTAGMASPADFGKLLGGLASGVKPGLREAREVLRSGVLLKTLKMDDMQAANTLELMVAQGRPQGFGQWLAYVVSLGGLTRYAFRAMGAMDAVFWYSAQEGMANLAASRVLRKAGGLKPGTPAFNAAFIRELGGDETQYLADLDQARDELRAAGVPVAVSAVNRRAWEIRQQRRSLAVQDASVRWADRIVNQQQPEGIGAVVTKIINMLQNFRPLGVPVFVPLVPFNRIVSNLFESQLDWAGVGILRGIVRSHLSEVLNKDKRMFDTVERRERFFAGVMGMGVAGAVLAAAMAVKDMDDEEVPFMVYGFGPPDKAKRDLMPKDWRMFSMKVGKNYVSFAESPLGPLLGAVGGWLDAVRYGKHENKTMVERGTLAFNSALGSFSSLGVLSSLKEVTDLATGQSSVRAMQQTALSPVPGFVPLQGLMRDAAIVFDDTKISNGETLGALVKDIPVLKSYGRPALNVLGEEVKISGLPVVRRFYTRQKPDANIAFIQKHDLRISALDPTIPIGKYLPPRERGALGLEESDQRRALGMVAIENGVLTPDQQYQFTQRQGELIRESLGRLRNSFTAPPSPEQTRLIQRQLEAATDAARKVAMRELVAELR